MLLPPPVTTPTVPRPPLLRCHPPSPHCVQPRCYATHRSFAQLFPPLSSCSRGSTRWGRLLAEGPGWQSAATGVVVVGGRMRGFVQKAGTQHVLLFVSGESARIRPPSPSHLANQLSLSHVLLCLDVCRPRCLAQRRMFAALGWSGALNCTSRIFFFFLMEQ